MRSASLRFVRPAAGPHPVRALALEPLPDGEPEWLKDLRLFATGWLAGLVFFGTLFG